MSDKNVESVDQIERPVRERTYTERGLAYQIEQRSYSTKQLISRWHSDAEKLSVVLSDSSDPNAITPLRDQLIRVMNELRQEYGTLKSLLGTESREAPIHKKYEDIEQEHHRLITTVSEVLRDIKSESFDIFSKAHSKLSPFVSQIHNLASFISKIHNLASFRKTRINSQGRSFENKVKIPRY